MMVFFLRKLWPFSSRDLLQRYANFILAAAHQSQAAILSEVRKRYPRNTQFIVLPMDLRGMNRGKPKVDIRQQHEELAVLAGQFPDVVIPFVHIDPRSGSELDGPNALEFIREFHGRGFRGIKLYPPLGYDAADSKVIPIYDYADNHRLPVMTHCSRGGVRVKGFDNEQVWRLTAPHRYRDVLARFPRLKLCLAHFGGEQDWEDYLDNPWSSATASAGESNWLRQISLMIRSGDYPNLYTDISYTIFRFERFVPILKVLLSNPVIRNRTLFGSDYYMIEQEKFSERELSMRLRAEIGEEWFWQIAEKNPGDYLSTH